MQKCGARCPSVLLRCVYMSCNPDFDKNGTRILLKKSIQSKMISGSQNKVLLYLYTLVREFTTILENRHPASALLCIYLYVQLENYGAIYICEWSDV